MSPSLLYDVPPNQEFPTSSESGTWTGQEDKKEDTFGNTEP